MYFRTPFFAKRICDGVYSRADMTKKIRELYRSSLRTTGSEFADAVAEAFSDQYDYQRLSKRIGGGKNKNLFVFCPQEGIKK